MKVSYHGHLPFLCIIFPDHKLKSKVFYGRIEQPLKGENKMILFHEATEYLKQGGVLGYFMPFATLSDRKAWTSIPKDYLNQLIKDGESYLGYDYPLLPAASYMEFVRNGNRSRFQDKYYARRYALNALVLAECAEGQGRFIDDIVNGIMAICEESGWQIPAHNRLYNQTQVCLPDQEYPVLDLFAAETGAVLAVAVYLLGEQLDAISPVIQRRVYKEIQQRIVNPYLSDRFFWIGGWNEGTVNNWNPWITQNVLLSVFLGLPLDDYQRQLVYVQAARSLEYFLDGYSEDGCCDEGPSYYRHAALCFFNAMEVLNGITAGAFEYIYTLPRIKNMAAYLYNNHVGDGYYANYGDASHVLDPSGAREYLFAKKVGHEAMMAYAAHDHKREQKLPVIYNLYYRVQQAFTEGELREAAERLKSSVPGDVWYPSAGLLIVRDQRLFLAAKMGDNDDSHNHNDTGSLIIYKDNRPFLIDVGVETYTKFTFSEARYTIWTMQSAWHNVINFGDVQQLPGEKYRAEVKRAEIKKDSAVIEAELKSAYPEGTIGSYVRTVRLEKGIGISVEDRLDQLPAGTYLTFMTAEAPVWYQEERGGVLKVGPLGEIKIEGDGYVEIERIEMTDPKLNHEWGEALYRTRFFMKEPKVKWSIGE